MIKSICVVIILFSSFVCFSQSSTANATKTTSDTDLIGIEENVKTAHKTEAVGTPIITSLGTPTLMPFSPSNDNSDQKNNTNGKNATKPR